MSTLINVTVEEFILWFDDSEASELSALNIPNSPDIYEPRISFHLQQAEEEFWSRLSCVDRSIPPVYITGAAKKWIIIIARYSLDSYNRRETVAEDYEKFIEYANSICSNDSGGTDTTPPLDSIGVATFSI
nr:hypothetical protein [uncultured Flavobacterium sp.]